jgi:hypothetical protein
MNGAQLAPPVFVATWVCVMTVTAPPVVYPDFVYDASTTSDQPITVYCDDVLVGTYPANSIIRVVSKNPTLNLT